MAVRVTFLGQRRCIQRARALPRRLPGQPRRRPAPARLRADDPAGDEARRPDAGRPRCRRAQPPARRPLRRPAVPLPALHLRHAAPAPAHRRRPAGHRGARAGPVPHDVPRAQRAAAAVRAALHRGGRRAARSRSAASTCSPFAVPHQQHELSLGYRLTVDGKTILYSGDSGWTEALVDPVAAASTSSSASAATSTRASTSISTIRASPRTAPASAAAAWSSPTSAAKCTPHARRDPRRDRLRRPGRRSVGRPGAGSARGVRGVPEPAAASAPATSSRCSSSCSTACWKKKARLARTRWAQKGMSRGARAGLERARDGHRLGGALAAARDGEVVAPSRRGGAPTTARMSPPKIVSMARTMISSKRSCCCIWLSTSGLSLHARQLVEERLELLGGAEPGAQLGLLEQPRPIARAAPASASAAAPIARQRDRRHRLGGRLAQSAARAAPDSRRSCACRARAPTRRRGA